MTKKNSASYQPPISIDVRGATAPDGSPYVRIAASRKHAWLPRSAFIGNGAVAQTILARAGMPLLKDEWAGCRQQVHELKAFPLKPLISRVGWNGNVHFALPDGTVFSPPGSDKPVVLFHRNSQKCAVAGTLYGWRRATSILAGQHLATFVLLAAYSAPLLALIQRSINQGFELSGSRGMGKSTLQLVAAAVSGPADDPSGRNYWITANGTANGLEQSMAEHNDMPMIIEETNLFAAGETDKTRASKFNELVFRLADGTSKRRHGDTDQNHYRFVYITSTNEQLRHVLLGHNGAVADAASDRLLTIPIPTDRPYKVFDSLPSKWANSTEMAQRLKAAIGTHHGQGIRAFLAGLVRDRSARPDWVANRLEQAIRTFRERVRVDLNDGSAVRVADAFGLVYAAGMFALRYEAVSFKLDPLSAAIAAYNLHIAGHVDEPSPLERLLSLAHQADTIQVAVGSLRDITDAELGLAPAIVRVGRSGRRELLVRRETLETLCGLGIRILEDPAVAAILISEDGRNQTKRAVRKGNGPERFFVFRLPRASETATG